MPNILETGLIIKKETRFDKIRKKLYQMFFKEQYFLEMELKKITKVNRPNPLNIIIPKEIKSEKYKRL